MIKKFSSQIGVGTCELSERAKEYVNKVLASNRLSYGPFTRAFESSFAKAHNCKYAVFVNSGTSALRIGVAALKEVGCWKDGDEIIIPAITFVSDVNVIVQNNLRPVFVDVDSLTYTIDVSKIEAAITPRTRAIIPTHLCGLPAEMDEINMIAQRHGLKIIEDACEASFARYHGKPVGNMSDISCFSTYQAHIITTGVGGFAMTNNPDLAMILRSLANHGRDGIYITIDDDKGKQADELKEIISRRFRFIRPGYSFRATEMEAAIGLAQMEDGINQMLEKRRNIAHRLIEILQPYKNFLQLPTWPLTSEHVFMMFPIVVKPGVQFIRDDIVNFLEIYKIETRELLPLINQPFIKDLFGDLPNQLTVANFLNHNAFYIGCHPYLTKEELEYIGKIFKEFFDGLI